MKTRHSLCHLPWELARSPTRAHGPDWEDAVPARVPGSLLMDLYRAQLVPDPYFGENFRACQWAGEWTFWYRTRFSVDQLPELTHNTERHILNFETIDTYSEVFFNGHPLGTTSNMFLRYDFDVSSYLCPDGDNELIVRIDPPKQTVLELLQNNAFDPAGVTSLFDAERPFIRKAQMTFGWDNCPYLVSGGIPRPVWIESRQDLCLQDLAWNVSQVNADSRTAHLILTGTIDRPSEGASIYMQAHCGDHTIAAQCQVRDNGTWRIEAAVEDARLWWPNGVGEPNLYTATVALQENGRILDQESLQIGLREFKVMTEPPEKRQVDYRIGRSQGEKAEVLMDGADIGPWRRVPLDKPVEVEVRPFRLEVNGRRVFIKGLDWQNPDVLVGNETPEKIRKLVDSAVDVHMNMLRVWGGDAIEIDAFFDHCSREGIMVWQDFYFACALYPRDTAFLEGVSIEAEDMVKRLRNHTCLAMWCGDNESDMILYDRGLEPEEYVLNKVVLRNAVSRFDVQNRYYHVSSPSGGPYPRSDFGGDKRNWGPWFPQSNYQHIRQESARVISESGSKALPAAETVRLSMPAGRQWPLHNRTWQLHAGDLDRHIRGDYIKFEAWMRFFPQPNSLEQAVEISQFANAWGVKLLIERCRQQKGECGGLLIWKNADQWPCLDHGFYDYYGHPRTVVAWSQNAFAPVAVSITQHFADAHAELEVWLVNDLYEQVTGQVSLLALQIDPQGLIVKETALRTETVEIDPDDTCCLFTHPVRGFQPARTVFLAVFTSLDGSTKHHETYTLDPKTAYVYHVLRQHNSPIPDEKQQLDTVG